METKPFPARPLPQTHVMPQRCATTALEMAEVRVVARTAANAEPKFYSAPRSIVCHGSTYFRDKLEAPAPPPSRRRSEAVGGAAAGTTTGQAVAGVDAARVPAAGSKALNESAIAPGTNSSNSSNNANNSSATTKGSIVEVPLPVLDVRETFPYLLDYMRDRTTYGTWPSEVHVHVCYMAYRLGMPTLVYRAKLDLHATPTALLVERLKQSLNNVKCAEFVEAIVEVLARRIAYEEQEVEPFSGIPYELMEDMLKSSELRIIDINCIETFVEQYQSLRAANHGKQPTPTSALRLHRLVQILVDLRRSVHPIHRALHLRACTFSAELPPWKMIRDMTDEVQERLRRSDPENAPAQGRRSEAVDAELARIQRALKDLGSSRSSKQSINGSGELQRPRSKSVGATLWSGVKARTKLRTAVAIMLESVQEHRSKNVANLPRIATEPHSLTGSSIDTKDPRAKSHDVFASRPPRYCSESGVSLSSDDVEESAQSPCSNDNQAFLSAAYAPGTVHSVPTTPAGYSKDALLDPFEASFIRHQSHQSGTAKPTSKPISARSLLARSPSADIAADSQLRASGGVGSRALSDEECFSYPTATGNISNHARRGSEQTPRRTPHDSDSQLQGDHCVLKDDTLTAAIGGMSLLGESPASRNLSRSSSANKMGMESNTLPAQLKGRTRSKARIVLS